MSDVESHAEQQLSQWLADQHRTLVTDITTTLDIDAGLREALIPVRHTELVADLDASLDVEAGLAAIVPRTTHPAPEAASPADADAGQTELDTLLNRLVETTASLSPSTRLTLRAHLRLTSTDRNYREFPRARARALARALADAHALADADARALALADALADAHALADALFRARAQDLGRAMQALVHLHDLLSDVTDVDLRGVDLAGIPLEGLRWSVGTRWPAEWEDQIRRDSVEIAKGLFEIRPGNTVYTPSGV